jgi:3-methyladenine DNA glycosylase AlkD
LNTHHKKLLNLIKRHAGKPTQHTFSDSYLGNTNPRYAINVPTLRKIAMHWLTENTTINQRDFIATITSLVSGKSSTEKCLAGILVNYIKPEQFKIDTMTFDTWLDHLTGWVEVDTLCTGDYSVAEITKNFTAWKKLLVSLSKSANINKQRASLVLLCSPLQQLDDDRLVKLAFANINRLKSERDILITKAISWILRSMNKHHQVSLKAFVEENQNVLPKIAVREVFQKIKTGKKN